MPPTDRTAAIARALRLRHGFTAQIFGTGLLIQHPEGFTCSIIRFTPGRPMSVAEAFEQCGAIRWRMFSTWEPPGRA